MKAAAPSCLGCLVATYIKDAFDRQAMEDFSNADQSNSLLFVQGNQPTGHKGRVACPVRAGVSQPLHLLGQHHLEPL